MTGRSITVSKETDEVYWFAMPSAETTMEELNRAIDELSLEVRTWNRQVILVAPDGITPPRVEELARVMFGPENDATLVEETGTHRAMEAFDEEAKDRHAEGV